MRVPLEERLLRVQRLARAAASEAESDSQMERKTALARELRLWARELDPRGASSPSENWPSEAEAEEPRQRPTQAARLQ